MNKKLWVDYTKLREVLDFSTVLQHYGIQFDQSKNQIKVVCPFHEDNTPSCSINLSDHKFKCFGCDAKGNILEFVTIMEDGNPQNSEDLHSGAIMAIKIMGMSLDDFKRSTGAPKTPRSVSSKENVPEAPTAGKKSPPPKSGAKSKEEKPKTNPILDLELVLDTEHPYLTEVLRFDETTIQTFGLGFCSRGIMKNRIVIPIHNADGHRVAYVGRYASRDVPEGTMRYKMPSNFHKSLELFNIHRAKELKKRHVVVVEGYWSVMRLHSAGIAAVALMGNSISTEQCTLLRNAGFRFVTLLLDGDEEGRNATPEALNMLGRHLYVRTLELPEGDKPDSMPESILDELR